MHTQPLHAGAMASHELGDGYASGVSWGAVFAGAAAAAALSFILLILGAGLGLSSISPYQYNATPLGAAAVAWVAFVQLAASGIGGYMAGRLRVKWASIHGDEVHFRDTAHGLLAWAVSTLIMVAVLAGGTRAALSGAIDSGAIDAQRNEINRMLIADLPTSKLSAEERNNLAQLIAKRTGVTPADAEQARKTAAHSALWMFVALLLGAFVASLCATLGGRHRDHARVIVRTTTI